MYVYIFRVFSKVLWGFGILKKDTMVDEKNAINGCDFTKSEAKDSDGKPLLYNGSSSSFGEGSSADGIRIYTRRKRRKMCNSDDEFTKIEFNDKINAGDGSTADQSVSRLTFDAFPVGKGECSHRHGEKIVSQQTYQSQNGHDNGNGECIQNTVVAYPESCFTSVVKESLDSVKRSDNQTHSHAKIPHFISSELIKQSEGSTISELCGQALSDILNSDKFSELRGLFLNNFGGVDVNQILEVKVNGINLKIKDGAYETAPMLFLKDVQQVWAKVQHVGNEMVILAKSLSDISRTHYEQVVRKPRATEANGASNCHECGKKADVRNCLVCDSCEEIYHISCTELVGTQIPPKSWYCASCVSDGMGSPHDNCVACEKLKAASESLVNGTLTIDQSQDVPNGVLADLHDVIDESQGPKICFICKTEVNSGDNFRTCGHSLCGHKFYHYNCLTYRQLGVSGPCWYCPSCLCRRCLVDKDDDQIVLCDGCDQAYHIYCTTPRLNSIPTGSWFCGKCDRELKRIRTMKRAYESMQKKVKVEDESEQVEQEAVGVVNESENTTKSGGGLDMLVTAAKTLSHQETIDLDTLRNII